MADTTVMPRCTAVQFASFVHEWANACPADTAIGVATVTANLPQPLFGLHRFEVPIFNLTPVPGEPARLGFELYKVSVILDTALATGGEYAAEVIAEDTSETAQLLSSQVTVWGVPNDPRHDNSRGWTCLLPAMMEVPCAPTPHQSEPAPFLTLPTSCEKPLASTIAGRSWPTGEPGDTGSELAPENTEYVLPATLIGCGSLTFNPGLELEPEQRAASAPTGLNATVTMPQTGLTTPAGLADSALKETTVTLPQGLGLNPSAANGLQACSTGEFGFLNLLGIPFTEEPGEEGEAQTTNRTSPSGPSHCPDAAKVGTVQIKTPLLAGEPTGSLYLARENVNPFRSPLVLYLTAEEPETGVRVKLAGEVKIDPGTGRLTTTFHNTPQLPFSSLHLHFFGGGRASLATPPSCGSYTTTSQFNAWTGGSANPSSSFTIDAGPGGSSCPPTPLPFQAAYTAGVANPQAGAYTPFTLAIGQADGSQPLEHITLHLPSGIAALISQVTPCTEAQVLADACEASSQVGHTTAVAGLGNEPVTLEGTVYLTGPLKATSTHPAAPFGLLAVTHAAAGPFDLGYVPVLSTLEVDPNTAAVTVTSEPVPRSVDGVPVDLKQLQVTVERPGNAPFEFNPTNCDPHQITGSLTGYEGSAAGLGYPFQVQNCPNLPFHPVLEAFVGGHASKANGAQLTVKVTSQGVGVANIHRVDLQLPKQLPSRLTTIQKACVAATFEANPASCPEGSVIGSATIHTPVFKNPLTGPAYLVSHGNAAFPDVEFILQGEGLQIVLDGHTDIKKGITYSRFESAPDAPFTTFETTLPTGPHSALTVNVAESKHYSLCGEKLSMPTTLEGQNGATINPTTHIQIQGCTQVKSNRARKLTRKQQLALALKNCRKRYRHNRHRRAACERSARHRYAANKHAKAHKSSQARQGGRPR
ncbi:MAG TPA: hypothetical protein VMG62_03280 [Solirubrobacteraceae bacterium]|nr:hypothetical protein [Solirubrobacteraceae bacterium]